MGTKFSLTGQDLPGSDVLTPEKSWAYFKGLEAKNSAERRFYDQFTNPATAFLLGNISAEEWFSKSQDQADRKELTRILSNVSSNIAHRPDISPSTKGISRGEGIVDTLKGWEGGIDDLGESMAYRFLPDSWVQGMGAQKKPRSVPLPDKKPFVFIQGESTEEERLAAESEGRPVQRYPTAEQARDAALKVEEDWARGFATTRDYDTTDMPYYDFMDYHTPESFGETMGNLVGSGLGTGGPGFTIAELQAQPGYLQALEAVLPAQLGPILGARAAATSTRALFTPIKIPGGGTITGKVWQPMHFVGNADVTAGYGARRVPIGGGSDNWKGTLMVAAPVDNPFNIGTIKVGLTRNEKIYNWMANHTPLPLVKKDGFGVAVTNHSSEIKRVADSLSASMSNELAVLADDVFDMGDSNIIRSLDGIDDTIPGAPSIQDVASRLPRYWEHLSSEQQEFFKVLRERLSPIATGMEELGTKIRTRGDIITSGPEQSRGFYIPRGNAMEEGVDQVRTTTRLRGGAGFKKPAVFDSMGQGVEEGYEYVSFRTALAGYIKRAGTDSAEQWVRNVMKSAKGADGKPLGTTPGMRYAEHPTIKKAIKTKNRLRSKRMTLIRRNGRLHEAALQQRKAGRRRDTAVEREEGRIARIQERAAESLEAPVRRTQAAEARVDAALYSKDDLKFISKEIRTAIGDGRRLVRDIQRNFDVLRSNNRRLTTAERNIQKELDKYNQLLKDADDLAARTDADLAVRGELGGRTQDIPRGVAAKYRQIYRQLDALEDRMDTMNIHKWDIEDKITDLTKKGEVLKDADVVNTVKLAEANQLAREVYREERTLTRLNAELASLRKEEARATKLAEKFERREISRLQKDTAQKTRDAVKLDERTARILTDAHNLKEEVNNLIDETMALTHEVRRIKDLAARSPKGTERLMVPGLESYSFPEQLAHYMNDWVTKQQPTTGKLAGTINAVVGYSQFFRAVTATADSSAVGIHGLLGMFSNPKATAQTFGAHWGAWTKNGDKLFGGFVRDFNAAAIKSGRLTSEDWAREGLKMTGEETEFFLSGAMGRLQKMPVIKQANRAFGFYGDKLRLEWIDDLLEEQLSLGKTIDEMRADGTLKRLAEGTNTATGWSNRQFGGTVGELLLFAPRFLQARFLNLTRTMKASVTDPLGAVEAVPLAGKSMREGLTKAGLTRDIPMQDRIARRSMLRLIGSGTMLTFALNAAMGNETDVRLLIKDKMTGEWRWNSNFMRISAFGRDISLFGTYDSMLRLLVMTGSGYQDEMNVVNAWRGLGGGLPTQVTEFLTGEDAIGRATGQWVPGDNPYLARLGNFMTNHIPFASQELVTVGNKLWEGAQQVASGEWAPGGDSFTRAAGTLGMEFFGVKSSEHSITDVRREVLKEERAKDPTLPERYEDLSKGERRSIDTDPRIVELIDQFKSERVGQDNAWNNIDNSLKHLANNLSLTIDEGGDYSRMGQAIRNYKDDTHAAWDYFLLNNPDIDEFLDKEPAHLYDYYGHKYWGIDIENYTDLRTGYVDREGFDSARQAVLDEAYSKVSDGEKEGIINYITGPTSSVNSYRSGTKFTDPRVQQYVAEYERDMEIIRSGNEEIREEFLDRLIERGKDRHIELLEDYEKMSTEDQQQVKNWLSPREIPKTDKEKYYKEMAVKLFHPEAGVLELLTDRQTNMNKSDRYWEKEALEFQWSVNTSPTNNVVLLIEKYLRDEGKERGTGGTFRHELIPPIISGIKAIMQNNPGMSSMEAWYIYKEIAGTEESLGVNPSDVGSSAWRPPSPEPVGAR